MTLTTAHLMILSPLQSFQRCFAVSPVFASHSPNLCHHPQLPLTSYRTGTTLPFIVPMVFPVLLSCFTAKRCTSCGWLPAIPVAALQTKKVRKVPGAHSEVSPQCRHRSHFSLLSSSGSLRLLSPFCYWVQRVRQWTHKQMDTKNWPQVLFPSGKQ